ncbi:MAG: DUF6624 domain-containing protein [Phycisphaerales bacterium]
MSKVLCGVVVFGVVSSGLLTGCSGTHFAGGQREQSSSVESYRDALDEINESDQRYRTAISWGTTDPDELARLEALDDEASMAEWSRRNAEGIKLDSEIEKELWVKQIAIDRANTKRLMDLIVRYGWPTIESAGDGFPSPVPVLIHMQMDDADWVLPQLRAQVLAGLMEPGPYAMIYDRKQQHDGMPQLYGMTQAFDSETRTILPPAIVDLDATNAARAEIGMDPLTEYRITDEYTASGH